MTPKERAKRREELRSLTSEEAITRRVKESVLPDEGYDADLQRLYELEDDLERVGPSPGHDHFGGPNVPESLRLEVVSYLAEALRGK
jgi:hypothetical protein